MLGKGLSIIVDTLNPQKIVIGSVYARCVDLLYKPMMKVMKKECIGVSLDVCEVVPAKLSENIGDVAALAVALEAKNETR
jgi:glucokinase